MLCSLLLSSSTCSGLTPLQILHICCSHITQPPCSSCPHTTPLPQTPFLLLIHPSLHPASNGFPKALPHSYLSPSPGESLGFDAPFAHFKGCLPLPLDSWKASVVSEQLHFLFLLAGRADRQECSACPGWSKKLLEAEDSSLNLPRDSPGLFMQYIADGGIIGLGMVPAQSSWWLQSSNYCLAVHS